MSVVPANLSSNTASLDPQSLAELDRRFSTAPAEAVVRWAVDTFHPRLSITTSMTDAVLVDLVLRVEPTVEVVFIDTGWHFPETLETLERVRERYRPNLRVVATADAGSLPWTDPGNCCGPAKVAALDQALAGRDAWMSGLRRADSASRAATPVVARDLRGLVKVNPLATWTDDDVAAYVARHDVPMNPLVARGYPSVGCWPCTLPVGEGAPARSGRWPGRARTECGLHLDVAGGRTDAP